jgi:mono/diheme cytochrome c family protein
MVGGILIAFLIIIVAGAIWIAMGGFNPAATVPVTKLEHTLAEYVLKRSIARRAIRVENPVARSSSDLNAGLSTFRANCLACHGAPGVEPFDIGKGLNPPAPDLAEAEIQAWSDGELFWIISQGIRMTGMPAFSPTYSAEEIWQVVAFVRHLPELTDEERNLLQRTVEEAEGHRESKPQGNVDSLHAPGPPPNVH